jgi:VanZ family protein
LQGSPLISRTASVSDLAANVVGIVLGLVLAMWLGRVARTLSWMPQRR